MYWAHNSNVPNVEPDVSVIEKKVDNHCDNVISKAVTRQHLALLHKENEKDTSCTTTTKQWHERTPQNRLGDSLTRQEYNIYPHYKNKIFPLRIVTKPDKHTKSAVSKFVVLKILYRLHQTGDKVTKLVVLPKEHREKVFDLAHSSAFGGHMGVQKTSPHSKTFSLARCELWCKGKMQNACSMSTRPEGKFPKATLQMTDMPSRPFEKVAFDILGLLSVPSEKGNLYFDSSWFVYKVAWGNSFM